MTDPTGVATCRFARLTVRMPYPLWLEAEDKPWTCLREEPARPLDDASVCHECSHWMPHRVHVEELVHG